MSSLWGKWSILLRPLDTSATVGAPVLTEQAHLRTTAGGEELLLTTAAVVDGGGQFGDFAVLDHVSSMRHGRGKVKGFGEIQCLHFR